jgi:hypothetical protein
MSLNRVTNANPQAYPKGAVMRNRVISNLIGNIEVVVKTGPSGVVVDLKPAGVNRILATTCASFREADRAVQA